MEKMNNTWDAVPNVKEVKIKPKPPYWRVESILKSLRLKYRKVDLDTPNFHLTIPEFGIVINFNANNPMLAYTDWDVMVVDLPSLELNEAKFGNELIWRLIAKGYMAYLRNKESGDSKLFRHFLIDQGWGVRIIDWRLAAYKGEARHKFMIDHNTRLRQKSIHYILNHYPDFFDYLW